MRFSFIALFLTLPCGKITLQFFVIMLIKFDHVSNYVKNVMSIHFTMLWPEIADEFKHE